MPRLGWRKAALHVALTSSGQATRAISGRSSASIALSKAAAESTEPQDHCARAAEFGAAQRRHLLDVLGRHVALAGRLPLGEPGLSVDARHSESARGQARLSLRLALECASRLHHAVATTNLRYRVWAVVQELGYLTSNASSFACVPRAQPRATPRGRTNAWSSHSVEVLQVARSRGTGTP